MKRVLLLLCLLHSSLRGQTVERDVIIYGATPAGIAAAVQCVRMGHSVALLEPSTHIGGLTTGGLGATDIGNKGAIGGISRSFYEALHRYYEEPGRWKWGTREAYLKASSSGDAIAEHTRRSAMWKFEPSAANAVFLMMLKEAGVQPETGHALISAEKSGAVLQSLTTTGGRVWKGRAFLDCTYEGDLMAAAGVSHHTGREPNNRYLETLNGVRAVTEKHQFTVAVDPWVEPGNPASGLLPWIQPGDGGAPGSEDAKLQAYNYRLCLTQEPANRQPWAPPAGYEAASYELLARYIAARAAAGQSLRVGDFMHSLPMPNKKTDTNNNGAFSTDAIGMNWGYISADAAGRAVIARDIERYTRGLLWFLSHDSRVPQSLREEMNTWGLCLDEWQSTGGWPPQLYVREGRRMVSDLVMTEHECRGTRAVTDSAGIGAYNMDSHNCQRIVSGGRVLNEGDVQEPVNPYSISYRSLIPRAAECTNLAVPVCMAATHIAYGSIRMEPVFMILGQSAATAACLAMKSGTTLQALPYEQLRERLLTDGQILKFGEMPRSK